LGVFTAMQYALKKIVLNVKYYILLMRMEVMKMPVYEYYCKECDSIFTEKRGMTEKTQYGFCPIDKSPLFRKYDVSVSFNGDGFYTNDKKKGKGK
jgi:putative FmdB family regulatory protein